MTTSTTRVMPPASTIPGARAVTNAASGNSYSANYATALDVLSSDVASLVAQGWAALAPSGPTTARPAGSSFATPPYPAGSGACFIDTTVSGGVGTAIFFDGAVWRSAAGAPV